MFEPRTVRTKPLFGRHNLCSRMRPQITSPERDTRPRRSGGDNFLPDSGACHTISYKCYYTTTTVDGRQCWFHISALKIYGRTNAGLGAQPNRYGTNPMCALHCFWVGREKRHSTQARTHNRIKCAHNVSRFIFEPDMFRYVLSTCSPIDFFSMNVIPVARADKLSQARVEFKIKSSLL